MTATLPNTTISWSGTVTIDEQPKLPVQPAGYHILIALPPKQDKVGGLYVPEDRRDIDYRRSIVVQVVATGAQCYTDKDRYPAGPWCKTGDWVLIPTHAGSSSFKIKGYDSEYRIITEDTVIGVVDSPDAVERV